MKIRYTPAAIHDLDEIEAYIRDTLVNPAAALDVISSIADDMELLKEQPLLGAEFGAKLNRDIRERYLVSGNYIVVYAVEDAISILRIRDTRTDYLKIIFSLEFAAHRNAPMRGFLPFAYRLKISRGNHHRPPHPVPQTRPRHEHDHSAARHQPISVRCPILRLHPCFHWC